MTSSADRLGARRSSARLGGALRSVLVAPSAGFEGAFRSAERRQRAGRSPAEGFSPYILAFLGGAAGMSLWLKVAGMIGLREVPVSEFRWDYLIASLVGAGMVALFGQQIWAGLARFLGRERSRPQARDLRTVWGAAALPQAIGLAVLLPLDLTIVGTQTYATDKIADPVSTIWAAMSIAIAVSLAIWSLVLFIRGTQVALRSGIWRALLASSIVPAVAGVVAGAVVLWKLIA